MGYYKKQVDENEFKQAVVKKLRQAIQEAEEYGLVCTEDGTVITSAIVGQSGSIVLFKEKKKTKKQLLKEYSKDFSGVNDLYFFRVGWNSLEEYLVVNSILKKEDIYEKV